MEPSWLEAPPDPSWLVPVTPAAITAALAAVMAVTHFESGTALPDTSAETAEPSRATIETNMPIWEPVRPIFWAFWAAKETQWPWLGAPAVSLTSGLSLSCTVGVTVEVTVSVAPSSLCSEVVAVTDSWSSPTVAVTVEVGSSETVPETSSELWPAPAVVATVWNDKAPVAASPPVAIAAANRTAVIFAVVEPKSDFSTRSSFVDLQGTIQRRPSGAAAWEGKRSRGAEGYCLMAIFRRNLATLPALGLAGLLTITGVTHFAVPTFYDAVVPHLLPGSRRGWTLLSGVAELACAAAIAHPRTRRVGATMAAVMFVAVFPANLQMAWDWRHRSGLEQAVAYGRLPLQIPLVLWALAVRRRAA